MNLVLSSEKSSRPGATGVPKLAFLTYHPTQFEVPLYRYLAQDGRVDLTVYYWNTADTRQSVDPELGHAPGWDFPLTDGYRWELLPRGAARWRFLRREMGRHDAVVVGGWGESAAWLGMAAAAWAGVPFGLASDSTSLTPRPWWKEVVRRQTLRVLGRWASGFLVKGVLSREHVLRFGVPNKKVFLFPYAVDNDAFLKASELLRPRRELLRREIGLSNVGIVFLAVLKCVKREGAFDLVRAFRRLTADGPSCALVLVGDGPDLSDIKRFIQEEGLRNVILSGYQPYSRLPAFYALADFFVHPAPLEPWGVSVNEAMASGLPIIASDGVGAAYDLVRDGRNGFVFPRGEQGTLIRLLETARRLSSARRNDMGREAWESVRGWNYDLVARELVRFARESRESCRRGGRG